MKLSIDTPELTFYSAQVVLAVKTLKRDEGLSSVRVEFSDGFQGLHVLADNLLAPESVREFSNAAQSIVNSLRERRILITDPEHREPGCAMEVRFFDLNPKGGKSEDVRIFVCPDRTSLRIYHLADLGKEEAP